MKSKSKSKTAEAKPAPIRLYPVPGYVLQDPHDGMIVLVAATDLSKTDGEADYRTKSQLKENHFSGVVLIPGTQNDFPAGLYSDTWEFSSFKLAATSVEIAAAKGLLS